MEKFSSTTLSSASRVLKPAAHDRIAELDAIHGAGWARARLVEAAAARERLKGNRSSTSTSAEAPAPTPERMQNGYIVPSTKSQTEIRDAPEALDVVARYERHIEEVDGLKQYVRARIAQSARTLSLGAYSPAVDNGGWRSAEGVDARLLHKHVAKETAWLARVHAKFGPRTRVVADALVEAAEKRTKPCPFETAIARHFPEENAIVLLNRIAKATIQD